MTHDIVQFCDYPPKYPQNLQTPKSIFLNPQNIEIQNYEPPKNDPSLRMYENIRVTPSPPSWELTLTFLLNNLRLWGLTVADSEGFRGLAPTPSPPHF